MGQIKISELTPKDAPLSTSDLLIIAQETPDGFESRSITGAEIIEAIPVPETNPRLLGFSGTIGTSTTSNVITICHSVLIPANTFSNNNILQVVFRMFRQSGNLGQMYGRIYFNTANTLTGATLFNTNFTMNGGSIQYLGYCERHFSYDGTNLTSYLNGAFSDYTVGSIINVPFNATVDNYVLLTMQCQQPSDIANINLFKILAYV
jgi:hypothetical protein